MGLHFDTLVQIVKKGMIEQEQYKEICDVKPYFERLVKDCGVFELPIRSIDLNEPPESFKQTYLEYLVHFVEKSARYGKFIVTPYRNTIIEDPDSMVFMEHDSGTNHMIVNIMNKGTSSKDITTALIEVGYADFHDLEPDVGFKVNAIPVYAAFIENNVLEECPLNEQSLISSIAHDIANSAMAFIKQDAYIMDPENFIIRRESNAYKKEIAKSRGKKKTRFNPRLQKTLMRPHYIVLPEDETTRFLKKNSLEPQPIRPIAGYWKTLKADCFVKMKGQTIHVEQYYRGEGTIQGNEGWHYQVMLKDKDFNIKPYRK